MRSIVVNNGFHLHQFKHCSGTYVKVSDAVLVQTRSNDIRS